MKLNKNGLPILNESWRKRKRERPAMAWERAVMRCFKETERYRPGYTQAILNKAISQKEGQ